MPFTTFAVAIGSVAAYAAFFPKNCRLVYGLSVAGAVALMATVLTLTIRG